jgi:hypothetical protein
MSLRLHWSDRSWVRPSWSWSKALPAVRCSEHTMVRRPCIFEESIRAAGHQKQLRPNLLAELLEVEEDHR